MQLNMKVHLFPPLALEIDERFMKLSICSSMLFAQVPLFNIRYSLHVSQTYRESFCSHEQN